MTSRLPSRAPRPAWLPLLAWAAGCVHVTDFGVDTEAAPSGSTSAETEASPTDDADDGSSGTGDAPDEEERGTTAWLQLTGPHRDAMFHGIARLADGRVLAMGEQWNVRQEQFQLDNVQGLVRVYEADGGQLADPEAIEETFAYFRITEACERPDGGVVYLGFMQGNEEATAYPYVLHATVGGELSIMTYTGPNAQNYPPTHDIPNLRRMVCDDEGRAWIALSHVYSSHPSVLLARFGDEGFDGFEVLVDDYDGLYDYAPLGLGRDGQGNLHLPILTGSEPGPGVPVLRWLGFDPEGAPRPEVALEAAELPGATVLGFAARGSRVAFTVADASERTWVVAYDTEGSEQWRTAEGPSAPEGWTTGPMALADDGSVVVAATVDGQLGLFELDDAGALRWSATYPFEDDGQPQLHDAVLGGLVVEADAIDVAGHAATEDEDHTAWVRRVLR